ncbi:MAG: alcohol dehydrogenase catalytic domain-containing protein [Candidatus Latescibacteria bacterium]|nr:alcohol dehydrogenase catalytic domain-containing protein [Candidatus Latescibacterota bacterium]
MAQQMRALQIVAPGDVQVVQVEVPQAAQGEVLVRIRAATVCSHWDLTMVAGRDIFERPDYPKYPIEAGVPGHEVAGEVVAVGAQVEVFKVGDRVAAWSSRSSQLPGRLGYYAEYAAIPAADLMPVPDHLSLEEAAILELAMCVAASFRQAGDLAGKRVAIGGAGAAGLIALQLARALGVRRVEVFEPTAARRELALSLGADLAYDPVSPASLALGARTYEVAFECAGAAVSAQNLMRVTTGPVHLFGVVHGEIRFTMDHWGRNVHLCGYPGHSRESAELAMALIAGGSVKVKPIIGMKVDFEHYREGLDRLKDGAAAKMCVVP